MSKAPSFYRRAIRPGILAGLCVLFTLSQAMAQQVSVIRDAEIERMIKDFARPFFEAAGEVRTDPRVYLVADRRFNAFVVPDGSIFINYGTIIESETPNELKAVIAHEIGHLAGGHLSRLRERSEINARLQVAAMLLGIGAVAASAGNSNTGEVGQLASALILASQSAGQNSLLAYRQSEESAADAAALKLLDRTGQSGKGMVEVLRSFAEDQVAISGASGYLHTHPLAADRLAQVESAARASGNWSRGDSASDRQKLELAQAKLVGYLEGQSTTLTRYPNSDKSLAGQYARIITAYKAGAGASAVSQMPRLVAQAPSNPFFHELLGQMHFETGHAADGLPSLRRAVELAPDEPQIRVLYGQALIDAGGERNFMEAVNQLERAVREERDSSRGYYLLSRAYAGLGLGGEADLAAAEAALARGDKGTALGLARKAQGGLEPGSPSWIKADDILSLAS